MNYLPNIHICLISPEGYLHSDALLDPALFFKDQFARFGVEVTFGRNLLKHAAVNFVFGAHNGFNIDICKIYCCVIVNLEQIGDGGASLSSAYLDLLSRGLVVDYDSGNTSSYSVFPEEVPLARFGYAPYLATNDLIPLESRPIDLLFFGSMNDRRRKILDLIEATGLKVTIAPFRLYGSARDDLIRSAKAVVNIPFYESSRFEQVRAFLCLSLGTPVLSERLINTLPSEIFDDYVTWFYESQVKKFFGEEFGTTEFYRKAKDQVEKFKLTEPVEEFSNLMAFASGVWEVQSRTAIGNTVKDATLDFVPLNQSDDSTSETGVDADRTGRKSSRLFQYLDRSAMFVDQHIVETNYDLALRTMAIAVTNHFCLANVMHHALFYPDFDKQIEKLAKFQQFENSDKNNANFEEKTTLFVATEVFKVGGHTKVLEDIARSVKRPLIVLTDLFNSYGSDKEKQAWILEKFEGIEVVFLSENSLWEKSTALARLAAKRSVDNVIYFQHHQDPIAFIGTLSHPGSRKILIHHCDANPSLGCTLSDVVHVDLNDHQLEICQNHLEHGAKFLPLHVPDQGCREVKPILGRDFSIATSGRPGKFALTGEFSLQNIVKASLSVINGNFYFIGPLSGELLGSIRSQLEAAGIDFKRFVPLGLVESLWAQLLMIDVSLYIGSAPVGGGRAAIEAQGSGLPTLFFKGGEMGSLTNNYSVYADSSLGWESLNELTELLISIKPDVSIKSLAARKYYEDNYSKIQFRKRLAELIGSDSLL